MLDFSFADLPEFWKLWGPLGLAGLVFIGGIMMAIVSKSPHGLVRGLEIAGIAALFNAVYLWGARSDATFYTAAITKMERNGADIIEANKVATMKDVARLQKELIDKGIDYDKERKELLARLQNSNSCVPTDAELDELRKLQQRSAPAGKRKG